MVNADIPGTWFSGGDATFLSPEEAACGHDLIEWAGTQSWSNGRVGLSGVSYLTSSQWTIAATRPPHLAAINPWEGWSDTYREVARHGGTGGMKLKVWMSTPDAQDMDIFVAVQKLDAYGDVTGFPFYAVFQEAGGARPAARVPPGT